MIHTAPILTEPGTKRQSRLIGIGTAVPSFHAGQKEILEFVTANLNLSGRTKALYRKTLSHPSIQKRHFAVESLTDVLETDPDKVHQRFQSAAVRLSLESLTQALAASDLRPDQIDFLATATCTGTLCPGLSSYLIEEAGLKSSIHTADLGGMGCGAGLPALEQAVHFTQTHPGRTAAVVCTEICSAAFFSDESPDIVISNTLFSDGSAALLLQSNAEKPSRNGLNGRPPCRMTAFESATVPAWRETLRFRSEKGRLRNVLGIDVPANAAKLLKVAINQLLSNNNLNRSQVDFFVLHAGGEKVLRALEQELELAPHQISPSRTILRQFGNLSSPTVYFVLNETLRRRRIQAGQHGVMASFGAGFSAHAALLEF